MGVVRSDPSENNTKRLVVTGLVHHSQKLGRCSCCCFGFVHTHRAFTAKPNQNNSWYGRPDQVISLTTFLHQLVLSKPTLCSFASQSTQTHYEPTRTLTMSVLVDQGGSFSVSFFRGQQKATFIYVYLYTFKSTSIIKGIQINSLK